VLLLIASDRLRGAEATVARTHAEYVAAFEQHLVRVRDIEAYLTAAPLVIQENTREPGDPRFLPKGQREADLAVVSTYRRDAEQLLNAAKESEEKAHGLLRLQAARHHYRALKKWYDEGRITLNTLVSAAIEVREAERMATDNESQRLTTREAIVDLLTNIENREQSELVVGRGTEVDLTRATLNRIEAEITLREATSSRKTKNVGNLERRLREVERKLERLLSEQKGK
jgi:hypothetical protein